MKATNQKSSECRRKKKLLENGKQSPASSSSCFASYRDMKSSSLSSLSPIESSSSLTVPHLFAQRFRRGGLLKDGYSRHRTRSHAVRIVANTNVNSGREIIMVDPLEAKRLAAKQMQEIQAKLKFKRKRQIEAINGAWAMIGLTAAFVVEGQTGNGTLKQLAGYWNAIVSLFVR